MSVIKGQKFQLAGFDLVYDLTQKGALLSIFAKFCGVNDDPKNLPPTQLLQLSDASLELMSVYPRLSPEDILGALVGNPMLDEGAEQDQISFPGNADEILNDLGAEQMALVLVEMGKAKKNHLNQDGLQVNFFIPTSPAP